MSGTRPARLYHRRSGGAKARGAAQAGASGTAAHAAAEASGDRGARDGRQTAKAAFDSGQDTRYSQPAVAPTAPPIEEEPAMRPSPSAPAPCARRRGIAAVAAAIAGLTAVGWSLASVAPAAAREPRPDEVDGSAAPAAPAVGDRMGPTLPPELAAAKSGDFVSFVRPDDVLVYDVARERAGPGATPAEVEAAAEAFRDAWAATAYHGVDPRVLDRLALRERAAVAADGGAGSLDGLAVEGTLKLLVIGVEFGGPDHMEGFSHEDGIRTGRCVTETVTYAGPLHNEIAHPGPRDNNTFWMPNFDREFFQKLVFSTEGITERVRTDLVDPEDGRPGIDIRGQTMQNYFAEVSGGRITFDGGTEGVVAWVKVPHSVGYYAANSCRNGRVTGSGMPINPRFPRGMVALFEDLVAAINASDPDFPWSEYDTDGDREIDHVVLVHAGIDESEGGGVHGQQQIWAHRSSVNAGYGGVTADDRGTPENRSDDILFRGYTVQPENLNLGVLVHEFGHDLGLPDLYTTTGDDDVVWWDLMSTGSHPGRYKGADPTHMSAWSKMALGWDQPTVIGPNEDPETYALGQVARPPAGTQKALRVDLPPSTVRLAPLPEGSSQAWWSGRDQVWADHKLARDLDLGGVTGPVSLTFQLDHVLEGDWDYFFVEVSVDGGATYTQTKGLRVGTGQELTTPDGYADPNGALRTYGGLRHGYTGDSRGWRAVYHDLTPFAGRAIRLRLRYITDAGGQERGVLVDNLAVRAGATTLWADPVEGGDLRGWVSQAGTRQGPLTDEGWRFSDGTVRVPRYYLLEWRNAVGFDRGLKYTYNTVFAEMTPDGAREFRVDKLPSNTPGLLVWLRDMRFGASSPSNNILAANTFLSAPSEGAKGGLLLVDAHPEPLRGPLGGTLTTPAGTFPFPPNDAWRGRIQTTNAAFGLRDTAAVTLTVGTGTALPATTVVTATRYAPLPGVPGFHDALGYLPGIEELATPIVFQAGPDVTRIKRYAFSDPDAGVVVPASGYYPPRTPAGFTGLGAETGADVSTDETVYLRGTTPVYVDVGSIGGASVTGEQSGNPGDHGVHYGYHFVVVDEAPDGSQGTVRVWRDATAAETDGRLAFDAAGRSAAVAARLRNAGKAETLVLYSDFDEAGVRLSDGSTTGGAVAVAAPADEVLSVVAARGPAALAVLAVPADQARAVVWAGRLGSGATADVGYRLAPRALFGDASIVNSAYGPASPPVLLDRRLTPGAFGGRAWLPSLGWVPPAPALARPAPGSGR